jgi:hypothetical protein
MLEKDLDIEERWIDHPPSSIGRIWIQYIWTPVQMALNPGSIKIFPDE